MVEKLRERKIDELKRENAGLKQELAELKQQLQNSTPVQVVKREQVNPEPNQTLNTTKPIEEENAIQSQVEELKSQLSNKEIRHKEELNNLLQKMREANPMIMFQILFDQKYSRLTNLVCLNPNSFEVFEWPTRTMRYEYMAMGTTPFISGVLNDDVEGCCFNWILSNGDQSAQKDPDYPTTKIQMMPEGAH